MYAFRFMGHERTMFGIEGKMNSLALPVVAVAVAAVVVAAVIGLLKTKSRSVTEGEEWPFYARRPLSPPEQILYFRLCKALPEHIILAQVQLSRLLGVKKGNNSQAWLNRINRMSADFVICAKDSSTVAVIELDDASHDRQDRKAADAKKDKALGSAGVRILRWHAKSLPDEASIRAQLMPNMALHLTQNRGPVSRG